MCAGAGLRLTGITKELTAGTRKAVSESRSALPSARGVSAVIPSPVTRTSDFRYLFFKDPRGNLPLFQKAKDKKI